MKFQRRRRMNMRVRKRNEFSGSMELVTELLIITSTLELQSKILLSGMCMRKSD